MLQLEKKNALLAQAGPVDMYVYQGIGERGGEGDGRLPDISDTDIHQRTIQLIFILWRDK